MEFSALVILIAVLEYMFFTMSVGMGRGKYGVEAPATSGDPTWERMNRAQQNTLEQLIIFIPALWIFSNFVSPTIGPAIGLLFLIGRPLYFMGYVKEASARTPGFLLGFTANVLLVLGGLGGLILGLV